MSEHDKAVIDLRKDVIDEVSSSLPVGVSASQAVRAIVERLDKGLPTLVELEIEVSP